MNAQPTGWTGAVLLFGLLVLPGCGPSQEQRAVDAYNRGVAHFDKGELSELITEFSEAIRLNSTDAPGYYNRGVRGLPDPDVLADCVEPITSEV